ncbi:MAG: FtsX-like permease family protein [Fulvivirga sp.]
MFKNLLVTALRNFKKYPEYSIINTLGITLGLTTGILIFLFVQHEYSYDKFHANHERIYRIQSYIQNDEYEGTWSATQGFLVPTISDQYAGIEAGLRIHRPSRPVQLGHEMEVFNEPNFLFADSVFFNVFTHQFLEGAPETALVGSQDIVLTKSTAKKYFGNEPAIGKILSAEGRDYAVSGVIEDVPLNSHLKFDMVANMADLRSRWPTLDGFGPATFYSYFMLEDGESIENFSATVNQDVYTLHGFTQNADSTNVPEDLTMELKFQRLDKIYLSGNYEKEFQPNGDIQYTRIFSTVAIFILLLASINYMNLASARSTRRGKEVGLRKVLGAKKDGIFYQFIGEAFIITTFAMLLSIVLALLLLPEFNLLTSTNLTWNVISNVQLLGLLIAVVFLLSVLSGWYPAMVLSNMKALNILKGNVTGLQGDKKTMYLRRGLVIFQFSISVLLITGTIIIKQQLNYIDNKDIGFDKNGMLVLQLPSNTSPTTLETLKAELESKSIINQASASSGLPGKRVPILTVRIPGLQTNEPDENGQEDLGYRGIRTIFSDAEVLNTFKFRLKEGRTFNRSEADLNHAFLLNEAAVESFEIEDPIGKPFEYVYGLDTPKVGQIIGVLEDFNYASIRSDVEPLLIQIGVNWVQYMNVRYSATDPQEVTATAQEVWSKIMPGLPFEYFYLDAFYNSIYANELSLGKVITYFTILAILIACLGLYGLASYLTEIKTKEIGVRKVLGASVNSLVVLFSKEFLILIIVSNLIAIYPAIYFMGDWLNGFSYKIDLTALPFLVSLMLAVFIASVSIGIKIIKAATANPVKSIRTE